MVAPIYLDRNNPGMLMLMQALGGAAGQQANQAYAGDVLQQSQGMAPEQQLTYLTSRLGPQGMEFVKNLTDLKKSAAQIEASKAETARAGVETENMRFLTQLNANKAQHAEEMAQLEMSTEKAHIDALKAQAAGEGARARASLMAAETGRLQYNRLKQSSDLADQITNFKLQAMKAAAEEEAGATTPGPAAPGAIPPMQSVPGLPQGGAPGVQTPSQQGAPVVPQSGPGAPGQVTPIPTDTSAARLTPTAGGTAAGAQAPEGEQAQPLAVALAGAMGLDVNKLLPGEEAPKMTKAQRGLYASMMDNPLQAERYKQEIEGFRGVKRVQRMPGITMEIGTGSDGKRHWIAGTAVYNPARGMTQQMQQSATGLDQWDVTAGVLGAMEDNKDLEQSGRLQRMVDIGAAKFGFEPFSTAASTYSSYTQHAVIALTGVLSSVRQGVQMLQLALETVPKYTEVPEIRQQKLAATDTLIDVAVKEKVEDALSSNQAVSQSLLTRYNERGLINKNPEAFRKDAIAKAQAVLERTRNARPSAKPFSVGGPDVSNWPVQVTP